MSGWFLLWIACIFAASACLREATYRIFSEKEFYLFIIGLNLMILGYTLARVAFD